MTLLNVSKKMFLLVGIVAVTLLFSCKDDKKTQETETTTTTETTEAVPTTEGDVALNPAHGQPGHRCDIPVGAPLDSPKNTPQIQTQTQQSPVIQGNNTNTDATTTSGLNPAHGQPGHRCDIPVGAPLNQ